MNKYQIIQTQTITKGGLFDHENDDPAEMDYSMMESDGIYDGRFIFLTLVQSGMMQANDYRDRNEDGSYVSLHH
jgi:hypothetical protein